MAPAASPSAWPSHVCTLQRPWDPQGRDAGFGNSTPSPAITLSHRGSFLLLRASERFHTASDRTAVAPSSAGSTEAGSSSAEATPSPVPAPGVWCSCPAQSWLCHAEIQTGARKMKISCSSWKFSFRPRFFSSCPETSNCISAGLSSSWQGAMCQALRRQTGEVRTCSVKEGAG